MKISIDPHAGFCFGVSRAIETAEELLSTGEKINCIGEIVHNQFENQRLIASGMNITELDHLNVNDASPVMIRAHGEPPETYDYLRDHEIMIVDATCPIVLNLQKKVKYAQSEMNPVNGRVVIYGRKNHPEIIGLNGQTGYQAIIIEDETDLDEIDGNYPVRLFAQTTSNPETYRKIESLLRQKCDLAGNTDFQSVNSVCRHVSGRVDQLKTFAGTYDLILFVGGSNSSNAKYLFGICKSVNPASYFINEVHQINPDCFKGVSSVGITGATSTPVSQMNKVADWVSKL